MNETSNDLNMTPLLAGESAYAKGDYDRAEVWFHAAVTQAERAAPDSLVLAECMFGLARVYSAQWKYAMAEQLYRKALDILQAILPPGHQSIRRVLREFALMCQVEDRHDSAEVLYRHALKTLHETGKSQSLEAAEILSALGELFLDQRRYGEAEEKHIQALAIKSEILGEGDPDVAHCLSELANTYTQLEDFDKAVSCYKGAFLMFRQVLGPEDRQTAHCLRCIMVLEEKKRQRDQLLASDISWQG